MTRRVGRAQPTTSGRASQTENQMDKSFCFFFRKEVLFFFEKKNQKTFTLFSRLAATVRGKESGKA
jgi:hypothetical protein